MGTFLVGMCTGLLYTYLFVYISDLNAQNPNSAPKLLMGLSQLAECVGEVPFMFLSSWLISRIGHHGNLRIGDQDFSRPFEKSNQILISYSLFILGTMTVALGSFCVRYIGYSLVGAQPWWILVLELLHGPGFGLFYANMATFANNVAPTGAAATMQGVLGGIYDGFGMGATRIIDRLID